MIIGIATTGAHWCRPTIALCKQQCRLKNRRDNSHKSRPDYRSAKIVQCKPSLRKHKAIAQCNSVWTFKTLQQYMIK